MIRSVRGQALAPGGNPVAGATVQCALSVPAAASSTGQLVPACAPVRADSSGYFFFNLYANADLEPTGTSYVISIGPTGASQLSIVVTNAAYRAGLTYLDIAGDGLVVAIPPAPGQYVTGPMGPPGPGVQFEDNSGSPLPLEDYFNVVPGTGVSITGVDDPTNQRVDVTVGVTLLEDANTWTAKQIAQLGIRTPQMLSYYGDPNGTDDTSTVQNWLNYLVAKSLEGIVDPNLGALAGNAWKITNVTLTSPVGVRLRGGGGSFQIIGTASDSYGGIQVVTAATDLQLIDIIVNGDGVVTDKHSGLWSHGIVWKDIFVVRGEFSNLVTGVLVDGGTSGSLDGFLCDGAKFSNIVGTNAGQGYGVNCSGGNSQTTAMGAEVVNCGFDGVQRHDVYVSFGKGFKVVGNRSRNHRAGVAGGVVRPCFVVSRSSNGVVTDNTSEDFYDGFIEVDGDSTGEADNVTVLGNVGTNPLNPVPMIVCGTTTPSTDGYPTNVTFAHNKLKMLAAASGGNAFALYAGKHIQFVENPIEMVGATSSTSLIALDAYGETAGTALYTDDVEISRNPMSSSDAGGTVTAIRLAPAHGASSILTTFRANRPVGTDATFAVSASVTNPNISVFDQPIDGLTLQAGTTLLPVLPAAPTLTSLGIGSSGQAVQAQLALATAAGQFRNLLMSSGGLNRWLIRATNSAESGSNVGSDLQIVCFADDGVTIIATVSINRATGAWTFPAGAISQAAISGLASALALLAPLVSPAFTGTPTAPTKAPLTNNTDLATTAYSDAAVAVEAARAGTAEGLLAPKASPALTGTPTAPTAAALTNTTQLATTAYADAAVAARRPPATFATPSNPATTVSTTQVMAGLAVPFTPTQTGKVLVTITGGVGTETGVASASIIGKYGTGAAPINGAALTGTSFPQGSMFFRPTTFATSTQMPFTTIGTLTGLTVGTTYWFDLGYATNNASDAALLQSIVVTIQEVS